MTEQERWEFDFRPPNVIFPDAISIQIDGKWVEGNASVELLNGKWSVGFYVWSGHVEEAVQIQMSKILGFPVEWERCSCGNGHGYGILKRNTA